MTAETENLTPLTPMIRQYLEIKEQHKDAILLFRLGDFYEMFFDDAVTASKVLDITLTSRNKNNENPVPLCGVPYHAVQGYISKLTSEGFKVAICDQVEDPRFAKGIVKREITRVVTPGLVLESESLDSKKNNYLASIAVEDGKFGLSFIDISTGEFQTGEWGGIGECLDEVLKLSAREVLLPESLKNSDLAGLLNKNIPNVRLAFQPDWIFDFDYSYKILTGHFSVKNLDGFNLRELKPGISSAGAILHYIRETQKTDKFSHITTLKRYERMDCLYIGEETRRHLELTRSPDGDTKGTLISILDKTETSMGSRSLRQWLERPLIDIEKMNERFDAIDESLSDGNWETGVRAILRQIADIERINSRVALGVVTPRDLAALRDSLVVLPKVGELLSKRKGKFFGEISSGWDSLDDILKLLNSALVDEPPFAQRDGGIIRSGYSKELDELRSISSDGKQFIAEMESSERRRTGINSLKVRFNRVFGYYIEVTNTNLPLVPEDYIRKQTLANAERFITPTLKTYEDKILGAEEKIKAIEFDLFSEIRSSVARHSERIQKAARFLAGIDTILSFASVAKENRYSRPVVDEGDVIDIKDGRHPVIERIDPTEPFIPNDIYMDTGTNRLLIITGPNMAGKSTLMRQVALIVLMAQAGSFVPARSARIGRIDRLFTRVGAQDRLIRGASTFMVEMIETANILNYATKKSLILFDEIGRGTSTFDGVSIAWAVAEFLHDKISARTLFATHYHELTDLALTKDGVKNYNVAVKESGEEIVFLRKLTPGGAGRSYGINVARLAGLPPEVIERSKEILENLEQGELSETGMPRLARGSGAKANRNQLKLFDH